ncbi:uncharacterized protein HaLaN_02392, partial [Haematococcus lacustris]
MWVLGLKSLVALSASEEELLSRMRAVEAAELEAAAAATPTVDTPPPAAKGKPGTKGASQSLSHNNDKDFARRMEAWARMKADDAEELSAKHGGLAGVLVEACGAVLLRLENPDLEGGTPGSLAAQKELQLPVLQAQVMALVGAPHNFVGFPAADAPGLHESEARLPSASSLTQLGGEGAAAALPPPLDDAIIKQQAQHAFAGDPIRSYLMKEVMPAVTEALRLIARDRPRQPLRFLGHHLLQEANKHEAMVVDPYDHPSYQEHVVKLMDKQQRDQARAVAAAEKAQKELAAKLAAKAAAMDGVQ